MIEVLQTIALLCQLHSGRLDLDYIEQEQRKCHQYYAKCFMEKVGHGPSVLAECIKEKK